MLGKGTTMNMTNQVKHKILCVDDEVNIINSLKRLLRKEEYDLLSATSGKEGLEILRNNKVNLVIVDQRMPEMSGTEFLSEIKVKYPEVIRIILTGYTELDSVTESINRGHIYKFLLKPWNDENLKIEIRNALNQYDLIQTNTKLSSTIIEQNTRLKNLNDDLILSKVILESIPFPIICVSGEGLIVQTNGRVKDLPVENGSITIGKAMSDYFSEEVIELCCRSVDIFEIKTISGYMISGESHSIIFSPILGNDKTKGRVLTIIADKLI